jgi:hypothetical protein
MLPILRFCFLQVDLRSVWDIPKNIAPLKGFYCELRMQTTSAFDHSLLILQVFSTYVPCCGEYFRTIFYLCFRLC